MARVAFIQRTVAEHLGIMWISATLQAHGHDARIFVRTEERDLLGALADYRPHLIGLPVMTGEHQQALELARRCKARFGSRVPIILGGPHTTFFPEILADPSVDLITRGEAEHTVLELVERLDAPDRWDEILGLAFKRDGAIVETELRPLLADLDALPDPDRSLYDRYPFLRRYGLKSIITSRGCPHRCSFCFNAQYRELFRGRGPHLRRRSPARVIQEIEALVRRFQLDAVHVYDDMFIIDREWLFEFLGLYRQRFDLPFTCSITCNLVTEEIVARLAESGCSVVSFGVETGNDERRQQLLKKPISNAQIRQAAGWLRKYGIRYKTFSILGLPGETLEHAWETVALNQEIRADYPWSSLFQPYPGTWLGEYARDHGHITGELNPDAIATSFFKDSVLKTDPRIVNLQKLFFPAVRYPRLRPLIEQLIRLPAGPHFEAVFAAFYLFVIIRGNYHMDLWSLFRLASRVVRSYGKG